MFLINLYTAPKKFVKPGMVGCNFCTMNGEFLYYLIFARELGKEAVGLSADGLFRSVHCVAS